ncbi:MAG: hypothetical protein KF760_32280 [Candidatus Eremiobacteraeota bacterium]|nr:hypothetical protein [Candidatus Eremiobacteraeota bacterium]MCW5870795.1 hypothetical protein [Candidatus Eremiobacteraeota bacterium]
MLQLIPHKPALTQDCSLEVLITLDPDRLSARGAMRWEKLEMAQEGARCIP